MVCYNFTGNPVLPEENTYILIEILRLYRMKLLTVTVPCYNSQDYMEKCIESLLRGGERVEIIVINDGSKDNTGAIGDRYAAQYPDIVKVIHQENGGHGAGINAGLKAATGDRKSTRLNSSHVALSRMPSSA